MCLSKSRTVPGTAAAKPELMKKGLNSISVPSVGIVHISKQKFFSENNNTQIYPERILLDVKCMHEPLRQKKNNIYNKIKKCGYKI